MNAPQPPSFLGAVDLAPRDPILGISEAFNAELAHMNLLSYPMIAIPSMLMMMAILYYLWRTIHDLTGLSLEEIMAAHHRDKH